MVFCPTEGQLTKIKRARYNRLLLGCYPYVDYNFFFLIAIAIVTAIPPQSKTAPNTNIPIEPPLISWTPPVSPSATRIRTS